MHVLRFLWQVERRVLPLVDRELSIWQARAQRIPSEASRQMALRSLEDKRFHCEGGSVLALLAQRRRDAVVRFIVAYQTACDYLDNLCDRTSGLDEAARMQAHRALSDAFGDGPQQTPYLPSSLLDGRYLEDLVDTCRSARTQIFLTQDARRCCLRFAELYSTLQVLKHGDERERRVAAWIEAALPGDLSWWERAAATGSTLGLFALVALSADGPLPAPAVDRLDAAYVPRICALHILLDYLIDREEDARGGDMNFTTQYADAESALTRLKAMYRRARLGACGLPGGKAHQHIVDGLMAMYLSDQKAAVFGRYARAHLLRGCGATVRLMFVFCRMRDLRHPRRAQKAPWKGPLTPS